MLEERIQKQWEDYSDPFVRDRVLSCSESLAERDFQVIPVITVSEANKRILGQVKKNSTVFYWEATTLEELGILDTLSARGNPMKNVTSLMGDRRRSAWHRRQLSRDDVFLTSVCAVTLDGIVVKPEPEGLSLLQPGSRPGRIIIVAGENKIVDDLEEGLRRSRDTCVPQIARRLNIDLPCVSAGNCIECDRPHALCTVNTVITRNPDEPDIVIVLIGQRLGH